MKKILSVIVAVALCIGVGMTARYFQAESISVWYPTLVKSGLTPPDVVFPIAWGIIYICMGISVGLVWGKDTVANRKTLLWIFAVQLVLNFLWSVSFFFLRSPLLGFIDILFLDIVVIWYTVSVKKENFLSACLFIPYIVWIAFATYLNGYIMLYN